MTETTNPEQQTPLTQLIERHRVEVLHELAG